MVTALDHLLICKNLFSRSATCTNTARGQELIQLTLVRDYFEILARIVLKCWGLTQ
jgi:hypothetical protein